MEIKGQRSVSETEGRVGRGKVQVIGVVGWRSCLAGKGLHSSPDLARVSYYTPQVSSLTRMWST